MNDEKLIMRAMVVGSLCLSPQEMKKLKNEGGFHWLTVSVRQTLYFILTT